MAARYGRNQRRQHRERIARLEAIYGGWTTPAAYPVMGKVRELFILSIQDETEEERGEGRRRVAYLRILADSPTERLLARAFRERGRVEWREISWRVDDALFLEASGNVIVRVRLVTWAGRTIGRIR
ncbi:MAG TPA: hypothetical protein VGA98_07505 [Allosphingosinicella sp.]|jgi:hypothetical protein